MNEYISNTLTAPVLPAAVRCMCLTVDTFWCSKCKMCRYASAGKIKFREDEYPEEGGIAHGDLEQIKAAVEFCPIGALSLKTA
jgi:ferredoxin